MRKLKFLFGLLGIVLLSSFMTPKENGGKGDEAKRVYMYGVSIDFNDSVVYMTDVQSLDGIIVNEDASIQNYAYYSMQMKVYLEGTQGETNQTCAVIYSENKKKLEKRYLKMRKKYQDDSGRLLKLIGTDDFMFRKE